MSRASSIHAVHPTPDPRGGIYPTEIQRIKNKIKLVLRGMARAARKGWRSYAEMIRHGAIQTQEVKDNGKEHHTGADRPV